MAIVKFTAVKHQAPEPTPEDKKDENEIKYMYNEEIHLKEEEIDGPFVLSNRLIYPPLPTALSPLQPTKQTQNFNDNNNNNNNSNNNQENIEGIELPIEIWKKIIEESDTEALILISQVCKSLNALVNEENEKYKAAYLSEFYPLNSNFKEEYLKYCKISEAVYARKIPPPLRTRSIFNRFACFDPNFRSECSWKQRYHLRKHILANYQSNPIEWLHTNDNVVDDVDMHHFEFFRIRHTIVNGSPPPPPGCEKKRTRNNDCSWNECELLCLSSFLMPIRFIVRYGVHPSYHYSRGANQFEKYDEDNEGNDDDDDDGGDDDGGDDDEKRVVGKKMKRENEGEEEDEKKGTQRKEKRKRDMITSTYQTPSRIPPTIEITNNSGYESDEHEDEVFLSQHLSEIKSEYPWRDPSKYPDCPCCIDDDVAYEVYIWDYKKKRYLFFSRTTICRGCDECTYYCSSAANRLTKVTFNQIGYPPNDNNNREYDISSYGYPEMISLTAVASTYPDSDEVYIQAN